MECYIFDFFRVAILLGIVGYLVWKDSLVHTGRRGWLYLKIGFVLLLCDAFVHLVMDYEAIQNMVTASTIEFVAFLNDITGDLGVAFLGLGLIHWLPRAQGENVEIKKDESLFDEILCRGKRLIEEKNKARSIESTLAEVKSRHLMLYDNAPGGMIEGYYGTSMFSINKTCAEMLRYDSSHELLVCMNNAGSYSFLWYNEEEYEHFRYRMETEERIKDYVIRFKRKDGSWFWARLDAVVLKDDQGCSSYFYLFITDVNDKIEALEKSAESENRIQALMNSLPVGVYLVDEEKELVTDVNPAVLTMTGYSAEEILEQRCCESLCQDDLNSCQWGEKALTFQEETTLKRKDGTELEVLKTIARVSLNGRKYLIESILDISEQKQFERVKEDVERIVRHDLKSPVIGIMNAAMLALMEDDLDAEYREMMESIKSQAKRVFDMIGLSLIMTQMEMDSFHYEPQDVDLIVLLQAVIQDNQDLLRMDDISVSVRLNDETLKADGRVEVPGNDLLFFSVFSNLFKNAVEAVLPGDRIDIDISVANEVVIVFANPGVVPFDIRDNFFGKYITSGKNTGTGLGTYSAALIIRTIGGSISMETSDSENMTRVILRLPR